MTSTQKVPGLEYDTNRKSVGTLRQLVSLWRTWVVLLVPIIFLPIPLVYTSKAGRCAYAVIIMACYWVTEALPMAVTALLPVVLMPWLGVLGAKELAVNYLKDTNMLFFGGLIVAVAVERWDLHKRLALRVLLLVGTKPRWLMFGFMLTTAFLSMWISNTATTAMMIPIAQAVLMELNAHRTAFTGDDNEGYNPGHEEVGDSSTSDVTTKHVTCDVTDVSITTKPDDVTEMENMEDSVYQVNENKEVDIEPTRKLVNSEDKAFQNISKGITLCVAYAANIGGTATLTGTGPNLVMKGQVDTLYPLQNEINFSSWFIFSFPNMVITLLLAWFWLQILFLGVRATFGCCSAAARSGLQDRDITHIIRAQYDNLGPFSFAEMAVLIHFILLALMWLTRKPEFIPGWASLMPEDTDGFVTDATVAITIAVSLFFFPSRRPNFLCFRSTSDKSEPGPVPALLDWPTLEKNMAWSVVLVLGGGFALANACQKSGLSDAIGQGFTVFTDVPIWLLVMILCGITAGVTEVTSNVAIASIFLPIVAQLAEALQINPLYLMVPVTVSTSFAFMLPVATPPNAIVFAYGGIQIWDMAKAGIVMNLMCIFILTGSINTWGYSYFNLGTYPDWANRTVVAAQLDTALVKNCSLLLSLK